MRWWPQAVALLDVAAQRRGAAALDGAHDAALPAAERVSVVSTIGRPELAEDVRHLEPRGAQRRRSEVLGRFGLGRRRAR